MEYCNNYLYISNYTNTNNLNNIVDRFSSGQTLSNYVEYIIIYDIEKINANSFKLQFFSDGPILDILRNLSKLDFTYEYYYWSRTKKCCGYYNDMNDVYIHNIPLTLERYEQLMPPIFDKLFNIKRELNIL